MGTANRTEDRPAHTDDVFALGSTAKSITATLVMALVEDGVLDLSAPVETYLPAPLFRAATMPAPTIRQLLHMTGGIPHGHFSPKAQDYEPALVSVLYSIQAFPAGDGYQYSNYSFGLLALAAEGATGQRFPNLVQETIFGPLGMTSARVGPYGTGEKDAQLYDDSGNPLPPYSWHPYAGGGMSASLNDLEQYALFHMGMHPNGDAVFSDATRERMQTEFPGYEAPTSALGISSIDTKESGRFLMTSGSIAGGRSAIAMLPASGDAAIILINSEGNTDEVEFNAARILDALHPGLIDRLMPGITANNEAHFAKFAGDPLFTGDWCGTVRAVDGQTLDIRLSVRGDGSSAFSIDGQESEAAELSVDAGRIGSTIFLQGRRVRFDARRRGDELLVLVVSTDSSERLANDLPFVGLAQRCTH